jgi:lipoprotein-anchoring transpeptidase ErfK/SrfK
MGLDIFKERGVPLEKQQFTWREMVQSPTSKLDDDAFTRVRIILMNGLETEANRFSHACARMNRELQLPLARVRRVEQHQQTMVNWLLPADLSPIETTLAYEQVAIEVTASVALREPDEYMAQVYRFGLLEDFDHLYRFSALYDRVAGGDANNITQSYTDIMPGRPTAVEHRDPADDLREHYDRRKAEPLTKLHAVTIMASENQTHDYYMNIGPLFADPVARQLYAEIASIEEQHTTQYESIIDASETWLEKWLMHEAMEVYNYMGCSQYETNPRVKAIWDRFLDYELGQLHFVMELFKQVENRDPAEVLPATLPEPIEYKSHREFVRQTLTAEVNLRAAGTQFVGLNEEPDRSHAYRAQLNSEGSPTETVAAGYRWRPGTELTAGEAALGKGA